MTHLGYLLAGWSISFAAISAYIYFVLKRGQSLIQKVPESRRRWMSSPSLKSLKSDSFESNKPEFESNKPESNGTA